MDFMPFVLALTVRISADTGGVLITLAALCVVAWVLTSAKRSRRLARLLAAALQRTPPPA